MARSKSKRHTGLLPQLDPIQPSEWLWPQAANVLDLSSRVSKTFSTSQSPGGNAVVLLSAVCMRVSVVEGT